MFAGSIGLVRIRTGGRVLREHRLELQAQAPRVIEKEAAIRVLACRGRPSHEQSGSLWIEAIPYVWKPWGFGTPAKKDRKSMNPAIWTVDFYQVLGTAERSTIRRNKLARNRTLRPRPRSIAKCRWLPDSCNSQSRRRIGCAIRFVRSREALVTERPPQSV